MAVEFKLPDLGEGIHEAEIISVKFKEGDVVKEDDVLFEVETDKAMVEIPSPYSGTVEKMFVKEGQTVNVGIVMVSFSGAGDSSSSSNGAVEKEEEVAVAEPVKEPVMAAASSNNSTAAMARSGAVIHDRERPVPAAPAVRKLARELSIDLHCVAGTGRGGRVLKEDVTAYAAGTLESSMTASPVNTGNVSAQYQKEEQLSLQERFGGDGGNTGGGALSFASSGTVAAAPLPDFNKYGETERIPLKSIRRKIAESMMQSWTHIPHVTTFDEADITELNKLIKVHEESFGKKHAGARLTITSLTVKAVVSALKRYPQFNASLDEASGEIVFKKFYNIGIAVATERGLIVPVIHNADKKSLVEIARELQDIATKTRAGKIELDKLQGGTFTITNIGAIGGTSMSPMINYPECAILGMARAKDRPVVRDGEIAIGTIMPLALSFDHRLGDGAEAAYFVQHVINLLSDPFNFLLEE